MALVELFLVLVHPLLQLQVQLIVEMVRYT
jgi:hypothetical protein